MGSKLISALFDGRFSFEPVTHQGSGILLSQLVAVGKVVEWRSLCHYVDQLKL